VLERVTATVRGHGMFLPGESVLVCVSGGPDSTCLLHGLHQLRRLFRVRLHVFHFDHLLREGSESDARYVERIARRLRLPFVLTRATDRPDRGQSVEAWAHMARRRAVAEAMRDVPATKAALGHTVDDQAETVLLALVRGGGLDALSGIRPVDGPYVRPLIEVTRSEVEAFVRSSGLRPRADPTNLDTRLTRNALRHVAIPALERAVGREVRGTIARTATILQRDAAELDRQAIEHAQELVEDEPDGLSLPAAALSSLPRAISARVVRLAVYRVGAQPSSETIDAILDLAAGRPGRGRNLSAGLLAQRDREYVRVTRTSPGTGDEEPPRGRTDRRGDAR